MPGSRDSRPRWGPGGTVGLVVGATAPEQLAASGPSRPDLAFLVPGVGAQGGPSTRCCRHGAATRGHRPAGRPGGGLLVNVSRGIAGGVADATVRGDPVARVAEAARGWAADLPVLL